MYPAPNPIQAAATVITATLEQLRAHATPPPQTGPYDTGWTGAHCAFIYSAQTLLDFPAVPRFKEAT